SVSVVGTDLIAGAPARAIVARIDGTSGAVLSTIDGPAGADGRFGFAVAVTDSALAVGAPFEDARTGAVYVYEGLRSRIASPSPRGGDQFGFALAAAGGDLFVGAPLSGPRDTGAVYVFDAATGAHHATLQKPTPVTGDFFGAAVAADAETVVVGAPFDSGAAANAGAVYVFHQGTAELEATLQSPAPAAG